MVEIQKPGYYQVSLEGLEERNDWVRGKGHFRRTMDFLPLLKKRNIRAHVMLTLSKDNLPDVIPLAEQLQGKANGFVFNRLSQVGEGATLALPTRDEYVGFMKQYLEASHRLSVIGFKDGLFKLIA